MFGDFVPSAARWGWSEWSRDLLGMKVLSSPLLPQDPALSTACNSQSSRRKPGQSLPFPELQKEKPGGSLLFPELQKENQYNLSFSQSSRRKNQESLSLSQHFTAHRSWCWKALEPWLPLVGRNQGRKEMKSSCTRHRMPNSAKIQLKATPRAFGGRYQGVTQRGGSMCQGWVWQRW